MFEYSFFQIDEANKNLLPDCVQRNIRTYCEAYSIGTAWSIVSRDENPEHFHGFKEKNIWRILTQATIIGKGGEFPKHSAYNDILHSSLLKPRKDTFNVPLYLVCNICIEIEIIIASSRRESVSFFKACLNVKTISVELLKIHLGNLQNSDPY